MSRRNGFTLVELMLSLSLIVVATALIGSLMQLYSRDFATRGDDIRRQQLAKTLLKNIADDVRSVVMEVEYDASVLEQLMGSTASSAATGAASAGGDTTGGGASTGLASSMDTSTSDYGSESSDDLSGEVSTAREMGIYGDQFTLMVDVSEVPRMDEYMGETVNVMSGTIADVPGDLKTVTWFVQSATTQGVQDEMSAFTQQDANDAMNAGLVRRRLDRRVTAYAEEVGDLDRLARTGDIVAPEVVSVEFAYYDGVDWLFEWDSSEQGLPWLVQITLAMQSATGSEESAVLQPGVSISTMTLADRQSYGIEVYELTVAIPGAQLKAVDATTADQAAGLDSVGL